MRRIVPFLVSLALGAGSAHAQDSCLVRGLILGHDGRPLPKVRLRAIEPRPRPATAFADRQGRFELKLPCGSVRVVDIAGVHHQDLLLPVILARMPVLEVEVRLRPQDWAGRYDSVRVLVEANGYSAESSVLMTRRRDGTQVATIPCGAESLRYQLLGVAKDGRPTAGTMADTFFFRGGRSISSIRAGRRPVEVVFDPKRLPRSSGEAVVRFSDVRAMSAVIEPLFREDNEEDDRMFAALQAHAAAGGDRDSFRWDRAPYLENLQRQIPAERDPIRRQYLLLSFVRNGGAGKDTALALRALRELPPESPLWALLPGGPSNVLWSLRQETGRADAIRAYAEAGADRHADAEVRAGFLMAAMSEAEASGDKDRLGRYTTRMLDEFAATQYADMARKSYAPDRAIRPGQRAPEFAFSSLEDSTQAIRVADFRGRHLLIDFWAVWCGPCRFEMPELHRAWETFKDRGLAILSVSFDNTRADVAPYRRGKWSMPWLHAFAPRGFGGTESAAFEVWGIPKPILIGPDGVIVAEGNELRGEKLYAALARVLGDPNGAAGKD